MSHTVSSVYALSLLFSLSLCSLRLVSFLDFYSYYHITLSRHHIVSYDFKTYKCPHITVFENLYVDAPI